MDSKYQKNIEKKLSAHPKVFLPQERIYAAGNVVYFTGFRLLHLSLLGRISDEVPIENVLTIGTTKFGSLLVETKDGTSVNFGVEDKKVISEFQRVLLMIQAGEVPEYIEAPAVKETIEAPAVKETIEAPAVKETIEAPAVKETIEAPAEERVVREAPPYYGTLVANEKFGLYRVKIFSDGYIQIISGLGFFKGAIEKLLEIEGEAQISKKTGIGRGVAGIVTLGANQLVPNQRGNLLMTVTTDKQVHVLIHDMPFAVYIQNMNKLVAVGKSVIKKGTSAEVTAIPKDSSQSQSLAQQIRELSELKDAGIISEKEFESAKQKLLS
jgi:hypothetical protein